ncbi:lectin C-type domain-containing protein [Elysia marginata]|uniref:Lectin C-type domain-containing protein n=1 Tax=Elysia marginata TaxID=1093978 RepID=A0AAV4HGW0_9GAST|nr:lectin C-type domain-containing protein [Elysia marginata]
MIFWIKIFEVGTSGQIACLRHFHINRKNYVDARSHCNSLNSYLVPVKTTEKLEVLKTLVTSPDTWIGLDDLVTEGRYVWVADGDTLTPQQIADSFYAGEPNNGAGIEHCVAYRTAFQLFNDAGCDNDYGYVCEKTVYAPQGG